MPRATTRLAAVVGHPIRHSVSPAIHNAAFSATAADWIFVAFDVELSAGEAAFAGARALGLDGLSVTMPLKETAARCADRLSPVATRLGAVNCLVREGPRLVGHNTDGAGFLDNLRAEAGWEPAGRRCLVLGAGGAARAVVAALADGGAAEVVVVNRSKGRGEAAAALAGPAGRVGTLEDVGAAELIVNATPIGMGGVEAGVWDELVAHLSGPAQLVADLVYVPELTALLPAAARRGVRTVGGLGMLVHQAGHAFTLWTGQPAPLEVMARAAREALSSV